MKKEGLDLQITFYAGGTLRNETPENITYNGLEEICGMAESLIRKCRELQMNMK